VVQTKKFSKGLTLDEKMLEKIITGMYFDGSSVCLNKKNKKR
jgi:hypothetical protein